MREEAECDSHGPLQVGATPDMARPLFCFQ